MPASHAHFPRKNFDGNCCEDNCFVLIVCSFVRVKVICCFSGDGPSAPAEYESINQLVEHIKTLQEEKVNFVNKIETAEACNFSSSCGFNRSTLPLSLSSSPETWDPSPSPEHSSAASTLTKRPCSSLIFCCCAFGVAVLLELEFHFSCLVGNRCRQTPTASPRLCA